MTAENKGRIGIICTALLWGLAGVCVKSITWGTMSIMAARSIIALIMMIVYKALTNPGNFRIAFNRTNFLGGLMMAATGVIYIAAIKMTTAGTAIVLQYIAPILVFLFEILFHHRKANIVEVILVICVFLGCVLSFADSIDMTHIIGNLLALLSGFTFAAQIIIMNGPGSNSFDCSIIGNSLAFLFCLPFAITDPNLTWTGSNILWVLILGVFQYGLANLLFAKFCKQINSVECSLLLTIEPIFNPIPVAIICGEMMGPMAIVGSVIVIISIALYTVLPKLTR